MAEEQKPRRFNDQEFQDKRRRPKHFDYEKLDRWERHLRSLGFENITIKRKYKGFDVVFLNLEMTLVPWEPLPDIGRCTEDGGPNAGLGAEA